MKTQSSFSHYKFLHHFDKFAKLAKGEDITPITVELDPVAYCNNNCIWCCDPVHKDEKLSLELIDKLLKDLSDKGVRGLIIKGGGEPTLHPQFDEILSTATKYKFNISMLTNGSLLGAYLDSIIEHCCGIRVSLDAINEDMHNRVHRPVKPVFNKIITNIGKLIELKKLKKSDIMIGLSFCLDQMNYKDAAKAAKLGKELGVDYAVIRYVWWEERYYKNPLPKSEYEEIEKSFAKAKEEATDEFEVLIGTQRHEEGMEQTYNFKGCFACPILAVVSADRHIYPCCNSRFRDDKSFGQVSMSTSFWDVWNSEQRKEVMKKIRAGYCLKTCPNPYPAYNEIINYLQKGTDRHTDFI